MNFLNTFLKGKLEGLGWGTFLTTLISERSDIIESFNSGSEAGLPAIILSAVSISGALWGNLRRSSSTYQSK